MTMELTLGQEIVYDEMVATVSNEQYWQQILLIDGYAGTGKTTLIGLLAKDYKDQFTVISPTGKAAARARELTKCKASTVHGFIYIPKENPKTGVVTFEPKEKADLPPELTTVIVDEASMISRPVMNDLSRFCTEMGLKIILIGDSFQLPPVSTEDFSVFSQNFEKQAQYGPVNKLTLTEIVRQAENSPIIRASQLIRQGKVSEALKTIEVLNDAQVADKIQLYYKNRFDNPGVIVCWKNARRHVINAAVRNVLQLPSGMPAPTDRLMVIQNHHEIGIMNGETFVPNELGLLKTRHIRDHLGKHYNLTFIEAKVESDLFSDSMPMVYLCIEQIMGKLPENINHNLIRRGLSPLDKNGTQGLLSCNFGYAMTVHKSQGSEWNEVIVVTTDVDFNLLNNKKALYTAVTRAKSKVFLEK